MMSSPWAMLITFIWPKVKVSPRAISSRIDPTLSPANNCETKMSTVTLSPGGRRGESRSGESFGPVVALEVRVGLDRRPGAPDLLDEPVRLDDADPGGLVEVLGGPVDGDLALGGVPGDPGGGLPHGLDVGGSRLLDGRRPQVHARVGRLHRVGRDRVRTVLLLERRHELLVLGGVGRLVVVPGVE